MKEGWVEEIAKDTRRMIYTVDGDLKEFIVLESLLVIHIRIFKMNSEDINSSNNYSILIYIRDDALSKVIWSIYWAKQFFYKQSCIIKLEF